MPGDSPVNPGAGSKFEKEVNMSDGGKGSSPRPISIPREKFSDNWDKIFGKKDSKEEKPKESK